jgi:hypothetical protein
MLDLIERADPELRSPFSLLQLPVPQAFKALAAAVISGI